MGRLCRSEKKRGIGLTYCFVTMKCGPHLNARIAYSQSRLKFPIGAGIPRPRCYRQNN